MRRPFRDLPTEITTIWERMQGAGYDTAAVGKWHLGEHANGGGLLGNRPENQGIEFFQGLWGGSRDYTVGSVTGSGQLRETISDGAGGITSNTVIESNYSGQYVTDVFGDQSADYIKNKADGDPFFLYSSFTAPHTPMQATASDLAFIDSLGEPGFTGNRRTYAAMQYAMDRNVGKIMAALEDPAGDGTGPGNDSDSILDDTLIIFLNDNGGDCCDSGPNASDNGDLRNGKGSQFEGGLRVPMIVAGAGVNASAAGTVSTDLVHSIDIVPTALIGAAGGSFGAGDVVDGVNLLALHQRRGERAAQRSVHLVDIPISSRQSAWASGSTCTRPAPATSSTISIPILANRTTSSVIPPTPLPSSRCTSCWPVTTCRWTSRDTTIRLSTQISSTTFDFREANFADSHFFDRECLDQRRHGQRLFHRLLARRLRQ